nr:helix-turn-helix domain-containing protein [Natroniella sulfidigena]
MDQQEVDDYDEIALEHAATVLKLDIQKRISHQEIETRYRDEFVQDLIFGNIQSAEEVKRRGELYDWSFSDELTVMIVDIDNFKKQYTTMDSKKIKPKLEDVKRQLFLKAKRIVGQSFSNVTYTNLSDKIIFLIEYRDARDDYTFKVESTADKIRSKINQSVDLTVTIGVGDAKDSILDVNESYKEAKKAVKLGRVIYEQDQTIFYNSLGAYKLLDSIYKTEAATTFLKSYLDDLITYDQEHNMDLVETLTVLVQHDWNMKAAAKKLFIHYNTMKYRVKKIGQILDVDLSNGEEKLNINLALKLLQMTE